MADYPEMSSAFILYTAIKNKNKISSDVRKYPAVFLENALLFTVGKEWNVPFVAS